MRRYLWIFVGIIALVLVSFGGSIIRMYTDWLWFKDLGYALVFSKILTTRILMGLIFAAMFFIIVYSNLWLAKRLAPEPMRRFAGMDEDIRERIEAFARRGLGVLLFLGTLAISLMVGLEAATHWNEWLKFSNATPFGVKDPLFNLDIGFYVFRLPFWNYLYGWFFFAIVAAAIATAVLHYANEGIDFFANTPRFAPGVKPHLAILLALLFFARAIGYRLGMYKLALSHGDLFYGAAYTDVHARLPVLWILLVAAAIGGVIVLINIYRRGIWLAAGALVGLVALSILAGAVYPGIVEQLIVKPNELEKQKPFIRDAIKYTQQGFRVDGIAAREFNYAPDISAQAIADNRVVIQNLRLWDYRPLKSTYQQTQELQQYYDFQDVDIDRYTINGTYRQVMLSARELAGPPPNAGTWVNRFMRYTHGYAYVMSPVNEVTPEGMPVFLVSGIPPTTRGGIELTTPQVYFGELTNNYVLVDTARKEFDYPVGGSDRETTYSAETGPKIGSFARKLLFALRFGDANILLSNDLRPRSRILFNRNIVDRVKTIFPFLAFDNDAYLVTVGGRLYWFHDAYTITDQYPYSEPVGFSFQNSETQLNYIRNSVKVITDAYTGRVQAYVADPADPIIRTYAKIFPGVFRPIDRMPAEFRTHVRYPEDVFRIQTHTYAKYHMTDPSAFYSRTDLWQMPEVPGVDSSDGDQTLEPYYIITKLPKSSVEEFILIEPLVRPGKYNMVAWMAAKCDPADYGKLIVYEFPRGELVFGPRQIMARANQDTHISEQLTLWNQQGSSVVRGNLLAIPIENSILYVEPLYLESTTTQIPEFKRVIVALGDRIAMEPTLEQALARVTGVANIPAASTVSQPVPPPGGPGQPRPSPRAPAPAAPSTAAPTDVRELTSRAQDQFNRAQQAQRRGDWAEYGRQLDALQKTLNELQQKTGGS